MLHKFTGMWCWFLCLFAWIMKTSFSHNAKKNIPTNAVELRWQSSEIFLRSKIARFWVKIDLWKQKWSEKNIEIQLLIVVCIFSWNDSEFSRFKASFQLFFRILHPFNHLWCEFFLTKMNFLTFCFYWNAFFLKQLEVNENSNVDRHH